MQSGSGAKNPPWARSNVNTNITGMNPQIMDPNAIISQQGMISYPQTQVFNPNMMQPQSGMTMPMAGQMPMNQMAQGQMYPGNVVAYPTPRAMNPGMYQNAQSNQAQPTGEQRVFTGTVTKTHNDFGFVDHDVFYQTSVCAKGIVPKVNDRVLVEATYNPNMPFKWNATRVQVLPKTGISQKPNYQPNHQNQKSNSYNAVPPPSKKVVPPRREERPPRRETERKRSRTRSRSRDRASRDSRSRRDSPPRKRPVIHQPSPIKFVVRVPRIPLDIQKLDVPSLSQRYTNLYIPSDFFSAQVKWGETFPPQTPLTLNNPCAYHVMSKEMENPVPNDAVLEPPDVDYSFSAKVMLISLPSLEAMYQKCGLTKVDDKDKRSTKNPLHPTRLIKFLVGQKGKAGENFAIGGPWSPSLDGENPQSDPKVLVNTAIRTCKALTGVDLSNCTQWYRMVEFYYWREGGFGKSRLECVVLFLPEVWSSQPSRGQWSAVQEQYKAACDAAVQALEERPDQPSEAADKSQIDDDLNNATITIDENDDDEKPEPTHYSKLEVKTLKVEQLRQELRARNVSCKGLRAQLLSRLSKLLKTEESEDSKDNIVDLEDENGDKQDMSESDDKVEIVEDKPESLKDEKEVTIIQSSNEEKESKEEIPPEPKTEKEIEEEKRRIEKEKQQLKIRYELPTAPHIIVHPSATAKSGKFNCNVATLSLLLDYRITDNKEHSFELFVFAELFNEMLMRDFGFYIYKTLYTLPEKIEDTKEKSEDKDKKSEEKKDEKKDDKRDEKRESRKRDRKDSHSDDERSGSPKRRGRGVELPPDPYLLLALVYFDTSRGGSMTKKDLQNLFMSLGLQLSRSQIKSVLDKVCVRDTFNYKTLMQTIKDLASGTTDAIQDLPLENAVTGADVPSHIAELEETIAAGNRNLLPIFKRPTGDKESAEAASGETVDVSETGVVMYKSRLVDVGALCAAETRSAASRAKLETALEAAKAALKTARAAAASTQQAERGAQHQLSGLSASLAQAKARITSLTASSKIFHSALKSIQSKVEAVVNIKYEDDDVVEIVNGPPPKQNATDAKAESKADTAKEEPVKEENGSAKTEVIEDTKSVASETQESESKQDSDVAENDSMDIEEKE